MPLLLSCLLIFFFSEARADLDAIPLYDAEEFCDTIGTHRKSTSEFDVERCLSGERRSLAVLKQIWSRAPDDIRRECRKHATFEGTGSYLMLRGCIELKMEKAAGDKARRPRREVPGPDRTDVTFRPGASPGRTIAP